jgi:hypothetical protein
MRSIEGNYRVKCDGMGYLRKRETITESAKEKKGRVLRKEDI